MTLRRLGLLLALCGLAACGNGPWPQARYSLGLMAVGLGTVLGLWPEDGAPPTVEVTPDAWREGQLTWLGHSGFLVVLAGQTVLIDPLLMPGITGPSHLARRAAQPADLSGLPRLDAVLITHDHSDHRHGPSLEWLAARFPQAMLITPTGSVVTEAGFSRSRSLTAGEGIDLGALRIDAVSVRHGGRIGLRDGRISRGPAQGYVLRAPGGRIFASGDTAADPAFAELGARFGPFDLALVPIAAGEMPRLTGHGHVSPEQAVDLALALRARRALPHHWGMFLFTPTSPAESLARFLAAADGRIGTVVPPVGGSVPIRTAR